MGKIQAGLEIQAGVQGLDEIKKLSAEIEAAGTDTGRLAEQSRELETAFARVSAQNALIAQYRQLKDELGYTKTALKAARDGLAELDRQMQSGATREQKAAYRDLQRTVRRLEAEQSNLQGRLKLAAADMRDTGRPSPCSGRFTANVPSRKNRPKRRGRKNRRPALPPPSRPRRRKSASRCPTCNA